MLISYLKLLKLVEFKQCQLFQLYKNQQKIGEIVGGDIYGLEDLIKKHIETSSSTSSSSSGGHKLGQQQNNNNSNNLAGQNYVNPYRKEAGKLNESTNLGGDSKIEDIENLNDLTEEEMKQVALEMSKGSKPSILTKQQPTSTTTTTQQTTDNKDEKKTITEQSNSSGGLSGDELLILVEKSVNQEILQELLSMQIPKLRSVKSLISTAGNSLETALEWLAQHQDDKDIDEPLQQVIETPEQAQERVKKEAQRYKELIQKKKQEKLELEKLAKIEDEKKRRESGKQSIKQSEEMKKSQKQRELEQIKREKDENERIKQKLRDEIAKEREQKRLELEGKSIVKPKEEEKPKEQEQKKNIRNALFNVNY